jgi:hypothetical protein
VVLQRVQKLYACPRWTLLAGLYQKAVADLQRHFAADALFGNWDVVGLSADNVLVDLAGRAWRIDNGGSFRFRAQGTKKTADQWNRYPVELWTLRNPAANKQTADVFGKMDIARISQQIKAMEGKRLNLPADLAATVKERMAQMKDVARVATDFIDDKFKPAYADGFTKHMVGIRKATIVERMPTKMKPPAVGDVVPKDERGRDWDHLRGSGSLVNDLKDYIEANGGKYETVRKWASGQAGSSWSSMSQGLKALYADQRDLPDSAYFWNSHGASACRVELTKMERFVGGRSVLEDTFQALHAFTHQYLSKSDFPGKTASGLTVIRTEPSVALPSGARPGDTFPVIRGVLESTSIFRSVSVAGSNVTTQTIPLHRVLATYWQEREPGSGDGMFLGDNENEFVCMLEGATAHFRGTARYEAPH